MMTTMAALLGTLPIALGYGAGGEARRPLGLAVVGGLVVSQLLTLYITPVIYIYLDRLGHRLQGWSGPNVALRAAQQHNITYGCRADSVGPRISLERIGVRVPTMSWSGIRR